MARARRLAATPVAAKLPAVAAALLALAVTAAPAQALRALHVDALSMRADHTHVRLGDVFHLTIHVHVREPVAALDELVIPDVGTMQQLGDERQAGTTPSGTDVVETLTLEPTQSGTFTFPGAYLDAVDARTGKPSRFSANAVRVVVDKPDTIAGDAVSALTKLLAWTALGALAALVALGIPIALALARARRTAPAPAAPVPAAPPPVRRTARDEVADALRAYRSAPANGSLTRLRAALFAAAGARDGATLRDALAATPDGALRGALIAAEHAAFGPDHTRDAASADLIQSTEGWLR
jgi:hypothetical protein